MLSCFQTPLLFCRRSVYRIPDRVSQLDEGQKQLRDAVARFSQAEIAPICESSDKENGVPLGPLFRKMGSMGLHGIAVPQELGGLGLGLLEHCIAMEEISRSSPSIGLSYGAHSNLCIGQIAKHGSNQHRTEILPKLLSGEFIGALAMTEPEAGTDVLSMATTAINDPINKGWKINGSKTFITNGSVADIYVVYAKTPNDNPKNPQQKTKNQISAFVVKKGAKGFTFGPKFDKLGMRGSPTCQLTFQDCFVSENALLGKENQGKEILMKGLDTERLVLSAGPIGIIAACLDLVIPYVSQRKQFGKKIGSFQLIQQKIAEMYTDLLASRSLVHSIAKNADNGNISSADCASAIMFTAERATKAALDTIQCLGGYGYTNDYPAGRLLRDAKLYEIGAGTSEIRRVIISNNLLSSFSS